MRDFFTKRGAIGLAGVLMLLISLSVTSYADEYKSMIRYDRIWECLNLEGSHKQMFIKCMRFDGTEEINGKTYHRIMTFKKSIEKYGGYNIEQVLHHEGFLREENGMVYTLVDEYGCRYIPSPTFSDQNTDKLTEIILYDFNHKVGDEYEGWTFIPGGAHKCKFKVLGVDSIKIKGERCKSLEVASIDPDNGDLLAVHTFIEGIGAAEYGCLNYHEYDAQPSGMWCCNSINRVFDIDGNVIFNSFEGSQFDDLQYGSFISEVDAINTPKAENDAMYDILGRRIAAPAPGQLYIQSGKKHIAK